MKKVLFIILMIMCPVAFAGCSKEEQGEHISKTTPTTDASPMWEDYRQGNASAERDGYFMQTEQGYYYYSKSRKGFRYYDITTGTDMFLCNKPECKHDGNAFCVATNADYVVLNACLYNKQMYVYVMDETDTQYCLKVLSLALDGSGMNEVATVLELEKTGQELEFKGEEFCIHRNKIMIALNISGKDGVKGNEFYGTLLLDLDTKNLTYMDETPVSKENLEVKEIHAYGDYFYYCKKVNKRKELHRYNIMTGIDETHNLATGFRERYAILGDNTIAYLRGDNKAICFYRYDTGETIECTDFIYDTFTVDSNGELQQDEGRVIPESMRGDGDYVYAIDLSMIRSHSNKFGVEKERRESLVIAYGADGKKIAAVNLAVAIDEAVPEGVTLEYWFYWKGIRFLGEEIYMELPEKENLDRTYVFRCKRSDLLAGNPKFEFVFVME